MSGDAAQLAALQALLVSAQELVHVLDTDPAIRRILHAVATLTPEDRGVLAGALERGVAMRQINESFARMNGVHLHINPNLRLFVRVLDTEQPPSMLPLDLDEIVPDLLRLMRRVWLLLRPEAQAVWHPAVLDALGMLEPTERQACLRFVSEVLALITPLTTAPDGSDSSHEPS